MPPKTPRKSFGCNILAQSINKVVSPIYKRNGFFYAGIIIDWDKIVGEQYSKLCQPLRVSGEKPNCCLYIEASKAVAAQMVYVVPNVLDRIHQYFGYKIFEKIKFSENYSKKVTSPLPTPKTVQTLTNSGAEKPSPKAEYQSIEYEPLLRALDKLWGAMLVGGKKE
jgi:hypothetical protein